MDVLKAPFPYFGGKSRVAAEVWARFGQVQIRIDNHEYCEIAAKRMRQEVLAL